MKKINIIKKSFEINKVINSKNAYKNRYLYIYKNTNSLNKYRFAVCVSKKIGNAVTRNKIKRQVKDIIDKSNFVFENNTDYVIILRKEISNIDYNQIKSYLLDLFEKVLG